MGYSCFSFSFLLQQQVQTIVTSHFHPTASTAHENIKNQVMFGLGMMIYDVLLPTTAFESEGLKHIFHHAIPWMKIPSRSSMEDYINLLKINAEDNMKKALNGQEVAITSDIWSSDSVDCYISVTGHFIDEDWNLQNVLLSR